MSRYFITPLRTSWQALCRTWSAKDRRCYSTIRALKHTKLRRACTCAILTVFDMKNPQIRSSTVEYLNNFNKMLKGEEWLKLYYFRLLRLLLYPHRKMLPLVFPSPFPFPFPLPLFYFWEKNKTKNNGEWSRFPPFDISQFSRRKGGGKICPFLEC